MFNANTRSMVSSFAVDNYCVIESFVGVSVLGLILLFDCVVDFDDVISFCM